MLKLVIRNKFSKDYKVLLCQGMSDVKVALCEWEWSRGWSWDAPPCGWTYSISEV